MTNGNDFKLAILDEIAPDKCQRTRVLYSTLVDRVEPLLDQDDSVIASKYRIWDKGDCSMIGLVKILLVQLIMEHQADNPFDEEYAELLANLEKGNK